MNETAIFINSWLDVIYTIKQADSILGNIIIEK